ncbi:FKBP-type peptidyl-prolyl cis-trans isomerase [Brumimicrobium mesophilum]|uniref:FKBP-type peptidyl-prolyl cis-trans isomerase n=1 Tax=Brumimicrobium mesophilum TaxID=392717 RepID=UPI000D141314|nr:FKBP-type peptidyl-prolyl cis-trans isomerase [Brumimicrobium mesophilum]
MKQFILIAACIALVYSCTEKPKEKPVIPHWSTEHSTTMNERFIKEDEINIRLYLNQRENWDMNESGSGLRYWIYEDVEGPTAETGDRVDVKFQVKMLNDSLLYETTGKEVSTFKVDKADIETGVMEGIKYLSEGDKAKLIIPSHIGHGLLGDYNKIPPLQVLVIDLELVKIH